jgi:hypothetical protein
MIRCCSMVFSKFIIIIGFACERPGYIQLELKKPMVINKIKIAGYSNSPPEIFVSCLGKGAKIYASKNGFENDWKLIGIISSLSDDIKCIDTIIKEESRFFKIENQFRLGVGYLELE